MTLISPYDPHSSGQYFSHFTWYNEKQTPFTVIYNGLLDRDSETSTSQHLRTILCRTLYLSHLFQCRQHDNSGTFVFKNHPPEVVHCFWFWSLENRKSLRFLESHESTLLHDARKYFKVNTIHHTLRCYVVFLSHSLKM